MARALATGLDVKRGDLLRIYPEDLIVNPSKRGREFPPTKEQIESLAASIEKQGQLQPVPVTITETRMAELAAGFTRHAAICLLNSRVSDPSKRRRIECKVIDGNEEEMFLANIAENRERSLTSVIDDAHNIRRLSEHFAKTDEEICVIYADAGKPKSPAWLENMRKLLRLSREQQKAIHEGQLQASVGYIIADIPSAKRTGVLAEAKNEDGKVTITSIIKAARKQGALVKKTGMRMPEVKATWEYLQKNTKHPKVAKLAELILEFQAGEIPELDFFNAINMLVGGGK